MSYSNNLKAYSEIFSEKSDLGDEPIESIYQFFPQIIIQPDDSEQNVSSISYYKNNEIYQTNHQDKYISSNPPQDEQFFEQHSQQSKKSTLKVNSKKKPLTNYQETYKKKDSIVVVGEKIKQKSKTKNLPKFFINSILNNMESMSASSPVKASSIKKKVKKFKKKSSSLITLQEMLRDQEIKQIAKDYICSFDFLDQILTSERLQDVVAPIQFINKLYQGCFDSNILNDWRDPNSDF